MKYFIENCVDTDSEYICDKLVEYNLSKVQATQTILFEKLDRKVVDEDGKIIAGCVARMYCWNVTYVDILWVDKDKRGQGIALHCLRISNEVRKSAIVILYISIHSIFRLKIFMYSMVIRFSGS